MRVITMAATMVAGLAVVVEAIDGQVLMNQNRALAGGVTPGDAPGFPVTISERSSYKLSGNLIVPDVDTTAVNANGDLGIYARFPGGSTVVGNILYGNQSWGIFAFCPSTVIGNTAVSNAPNLAFSDSSCTNADNTAP